MKANTIKAYNKRRRRYLMRIYAKSFGIRYAARRKYRENSPCDLHDEISNAIFEYAYKLF